MEKTKLGSGRRILARTALTAASFLLVVLAIIAVPRRADAFINVGGEVGLVTRTADSPNNLKWGIGYGLHGEFDLIPLLKLGPYYLHYELSAADRPASGAADAVFNTLGLRARLMLPIPTYKPYAFIGVGYSWANYTQALGDRVGHFLETPIGVGIAYEVVEIFQLSLDVAYRPGVAFGGDAFDTYRITQPTSGWSILLGAAIDL